MTQSVVPFGFPLIYPFDGYALWFYSYIWFLFVFLTLNFIFAIFSLIHSLGKIPFLKSKMSLSIIGLALSGAVIILICIMAINFFQYSAEILTYEKHGLSISFYTSLIYVCIVFCFSLTQLVLTVKNKHLSAQS